MPETAFLGAQIAPKSLSAGASPQTPAGFQGALLLTLLLLRGGDGRGGPRKIVHPEKFLRIGPASVFSRGAIQITQLQLNSTQQRTTDAGV